MYNNKAMEKKEYKKPNIEYIEFWYSAVANNSEEITPEATDEDCEEEIQEEMEHW